MALLVSCRHCKRAVLIAGENIPAELAFLRAHLAVCRPGDPVADALGHFRSVPIEDDVTTVAEHAGRTI